MLKYFRVVSFALLLTFGVGSVGKAASFDCNKATTETEIAICANPELSALDVEISENFFSLDKEGRYYSLIVEDQKDWIRSERQLNIYDFAQRNDLLKLWSALNSCSKGSNSTFSACSDELGNSMDLCMEADNYTTYIMNRCGGALIDLLRVAKAFETDLWKRLNGSDIETLSLFNKAEDLWSEFIKSDCDWQYSEYRDGTIRQKIWLYCMERHYKNRIKLLNSSNRFQDRDAVLGE